MEVLGDITFSHTFGFLGTSPFMWLGVLAVPFCLLSTYGTRKERRVRRFATLWWIITMLLLWLTVSAAINWRGGWTVGPRYLGAAPPFFAFGAVCALERIAGNSRIRRMIARAIAGGLAIASVVEIGLVGLHFNTIPESVARPLTQFTLPLMRGGFVPHHMGEIVGWMSPWFFYFVAACLLGAVLVAALAPSSDRWWSLAVRMVLGIVVCAVGILPALREPDPSEGTPGISVRNWIAAWEPPGRDRITTLREQAERYGSRRPCLWYQIADLERALELQDESLRDEKRAAGADRTRCR
jgi:hypothetical protein